MKNKIKAFTAIIVLLLVSIYSCKKEESVKNSMDFKFFGATDLTLIRGGSIERSLKVYYLGGDFEEVTFTAVNIPNGVEISYAPNTALPDSSVIQSIKVTSAADTGTFIINAIGTGAGGKTFNRPFKLTVSPEFNFKPVIHLVGGTFYTHILNGVFVEPGYSASDNEDGNLTAQVRKYGNVNQDSVGQYKLSYAVTDANGQVDSVVRTVSVLNNLNYLGNQYNATTTTISSGVSYNWITSFVASVSQNNHCTIFRISDCFPANVDFIYNPSTDSIYLASQTFVCQSAVDTIGHTYAGAGKIFNNGFGLIHVVLNYSDTYFDIGLGSLVTVNRKDDYYNF
jgi:hypothetical protein